MNDPVIWIIIALFYVPLHYLAPVLVVVMRSPDAERRQRLKQILIECSLSMLAGFALVIWLVQSARITTAMLVLLLSLGLPYIRVLRPVQR